MSRNVKVSGSKPSQSTIFAHFDRYFIAVSSLQISQISLNLSIKIAIVAMNINNSSMGIAVFFHSFIAKNNYFLMMIFDDN